LSVLFVPPGNNPPYTSNGITTTLKPGVVAASSVTIVDDQHLQVVVPSGPSGTVDVQVLSGQLLDDTYNGDAENATAPIFGYGISPQGSNDLFTYSSGNVAPAITTQPANQTVTTGQTATFTAAASGSPVPSVQWQVSTNGGSTWSNISGATATTYSVTNTAASQSGSEYRAVFTNSAGSATTNAAILTVNAVIAPNITTQPIGQTVNVGQTASFTAAASGSPPPTVQWQVSTDGGSTWSNIAGATTTTYSFTTTASQNGYEYRAVFTNSAGSATTNAATLTVNVAVTAPSITTQPANQTVTAGQTATFTAAASGFPTPTVQWQLSTNGGSTWSNISGATATSYSVTNTTTSQSGSEYRAVFTNSAGSATTNAATLTVNVVTQASVVTSSGEYELKQTSSGIWLFGTPTRTWQQLSTRTDANALYLSPNGLVLAIFPGAVMRWKPGTGWQTINGNSTASFYAINSRGDVLANWMGTGGGLYRYESSIGWQLINGNTGATFLALDDQGDVLANWTGTGGGLYRYRDSTGWQQVNGNTAATFLALDAQGDILANWTGTGGGLYRYRDSTGWQSLTGNTSATFLAIDAQGDVLANFAGSYVGAGLFRYESSTGWQLLSSNTNVASLAINSEGDVLANFVGTGLARYETSTGWVSLTSTAPTYTAFGGNGDVLADLDGQLWLYQTGWSFLTPSVGVEYDLRNVSSGIWLFSTATQTWQQLGNTTATSVYQSSDGFVLAVFAGSSVQRWEPTTGWQVVNGNTTASFFAINNRGDILANWMGTGRGLYRYESSTGWQLINGNTTATFLALDDQGDVLANWTGTGGGLFRYRDGTGWQQVNGNTTATFLALDAQGDILANWTGTGGGLYRYRDSTGWQQVNGNTAATFLALDAQGDILANWTGTGGGLYRYTDAVGWQSINSNSGGSSFAINAEGDVLANYVGTGLWLYKTSTGGVIITTSNPAYTAVGSTGDVLAELNGQVWLFSGGGSTMLSSFVPS
jgi:hypothetical protein